MGNEQSREGLEQQQQQQQQQEPEDHFDLSDISDDREPERIRHNPRATPHEAVGRSQQHATSGRVDKNRKKKKRKKKLRDFDLPDSTSPDGQAGIWKEGTPLVANGRANHHEPSQNEVGETTQVESGASTGDGAVELVTVALHPPRLAATTASPTEGRSAKAVSRTTHTVHTIELKRGKRKDRYSSTDSSKPTTDRARPTTPTPPAAAPAVSSERDQAIQAMREREPETFHEYAMSDDEVDVASTAGGYKESNAKDAQNSGPKFGEHGQNDAKRAGMSEAVTGQADGEDLDHESIGGQQHQVNAARPMSASDVEDGSEEFSTPMLETRQSSRGNAPGDPPLVHGETDVRGEAQPDVLLPVSSLRQEQPSDSTTSPGEGDQLLVKETPAIRTSSKQMRNLETAARSPATMAHPRPPKQRKKSPSALLSLTAGSRQPAINHSQTASASEDPHQHQITDRIIPQLAPRQKSIDGWAQKYTPGSKLRHPTLHPESPVRPLARVAVVIPRSSRAGSSSRNAEEGQSREEQPPSGSEPPEPRTARKSRSTGIERLQSANLTSRKQAVYTTPKGKRRAEPEVEYSTPTNVRQPTDDEHEDSDNDGPSNIATSVARRTLFARSNQSSSSDEDSNYDDEDGKDDDEEEPPSLAPSSSRETTGVPSRSSASVPLPNDSQSDYTCDRCHRTFFKLKNLLRHKELVSVHDDLVQCGVCRLEFWSLPALRKHQKRSGHSVNGGQNGSSRENGQPGQHCATGPFTETEVEALYNYRDGFCQMYDITTVEFNDMMTATLRRGTPWPYGHIISRAEFMKDYLNVLPDRQPRSMLRYRERNFQNLQGSADWTTEDDQMLIQLHLELGSKFTEIAKRMGRTFDSVSQRWRHKLSLGVREKGEFSSEEAQRFNRAVEEVRIASGVADDDASWKIPWSQVSQKMDGRSAQQCSNHWRAMHGKRVKGVWLRAGASGQGAANGASKPSKMEARLRGKQSTGQSKLSEEYVQDDEDEDEGEEDDDKDDESNQAPAQEARESSVHEGAGANEQDEEETASEDSESHTASPATRKRKAASASEESDSNEAGPAVKKARTDHTPQQRTPALPLPLPKRTPKEALSLSQAFAQTQANTSALRGPRAASPRSDASSSHGRPSPSIPIQRRLKSPPGLHAGATAGEGDASDANDVSTASDKGDEQEDEPANDSEETSSEGTSTSSSDEDTSDSSDSPDAGEEDDDDDDEQDSDGQDEFMKSINKAVRASQARVSNQRQG